MFLLDQITECLFCHQPLNNVSENWMQCSRCNNTEKAVWLFRLFNDKNFISLHIVYHQYQINWRLKLNSTDFGLKRQGYIYQSLRTFPYLIEAEYNEASIRQVFDRCKNLLVFI